MSSGLATTTTAVARCPHCRYPYTVGVENLGTLTRCEKCRGTFTLAADDAVGQIKPRPRIPGEKVLPPRTRGGTDFAPAARGVVLDELNLGGLAAAAPTPAVAPPRPAVSDGWLALQVMPPAAPAESPVPAAAPAPFPGADRHATRTYFYWTVVAAVCAIGVLCLCVGAIKAAKRLSTSGAPAAVQMR